MSERDYVNEINTKSKPSKKNDMSNSNIEEKIDDEVLGSKYGFGISPRNLEIIMEKYKERGTDFKDLLYFKNQNGVSTLIKSLLTNENTGISSL